MNEPPLSTRGLAFGFTCECLVRDPWLWPADRTDGRMETTLVRAQVGPIILRVASNRELGENEIYKLCVEK